GAALSVTAGVSGAGLGAGAFSDVAGAFCCAGESAGAAGAGEGSAAGITAGRPCCGAGAGGCAAGKSEAAVGAVVLSGAAGALCGTSSVGVEDTLCGVAVLGTTVVT